MQSTAIFGRLLWVRTELLRNYPCGLPVDGLEPWTPIEQLCVRKDRPSVMLIGILFIYLVLISFRDSSILSLWCKMKATISSQSIIQYDWVEYGLLFKIPHNPDCVFILTSAKLETILLCLSVSSCGGFACLDARCLPKLPCHSPSSAGQGRKNTMKGSRVQIRAERRHSPIAITGQTNWKWGN